MARTTELPTLLEGFRLFCWLRGETERESIQLLRYSDSGGFVPPYLSSQFCPRKILTTSTKSVKLSRRLESLWGSPPFASNLEGIEIPYPTQVHITRVALESPPLRKDEGNE